MQTITIKAVIDDIQAKTKVSELQEKINQLRLAGEKGIKLKFDESGNLKSVLSEYRDASGAVVKYVREWDSEQKKLVTKSAELSHNYEQVEKANARIEKINARILAQKEKESQVLQKQATSSWAKGDIAGYNSAIKKMRELGVAVDETSIKERALTANTKAAGSQAEKTGGQFTLLNTILLRLAHSAISAVTRAFRDALTEMKNVDSELVVVRKVSDATAEELSALKDRAYEVGAAYGVAASDYLKAAAEMTRAGYREQAGDLAELATKLQLVGDVSQETANQFLIATDKAYKMNGDFQKLSDTIDKLNEIDNKYATSIQKIADGIGILAPIASQTHVTFEQMAAALGTITAVTQRSGAESARALRSLFLNIAKDTSTEIEEGVTWTVEEINSLYDALKKYAPEVVNAAEATGQLINPMEAIGSLAQSYKEGILDEQKLMEIVSGLGGKLRSSQLLALIQNWDMYNEMLKTTASAAGSADREVQNALNSWQVKLNQLKNTFTQFISDTVSTDLIKGLIDGINWIVSGIGNLGNALAIIGGIILTLKLPAILSWLSQARTAIVSFTGKIVSFISATGSGVSATKAFSTAFNGMSLSATAAQVALGLVTIAITGLIIGINKAKQAEEERRRAAIEAAKEAASELKELKELKDNYDKLKTAFEEGKATRDEYEEAQKAIIKKLVDEGEWTGKVKGSYDELTESIEKNTKAALANKEITLYEGLGAVQGNLNSSFGSYGFNLNNGKLSFAEDGIPRPNRFFYFDKATREFNEKYGTSFDISKAFFNSESNTETFLEFFHGLEKIRDELYDLGLENTDYFRAVSNEIAKHKDSVDEYESAVFDYLDTVNLVDPDRIERKYAESPAWQYMIDRWRELNAEAEDAADGISEGASNGAYALNGLTDELKKATTALEEYKKALEGGEKGDTFKSYAEAYKKAVELFEKGMTGSNAYMSAIDLLIPADVMRELEWDYEEAGKLLGNDFIRAMFSEGGDDYGANAANYIRQHLDEFRGVAIEEAEDGSFSLIVTDMDEFAKSTGLSEEALWSLMDALDIFHSDAMTSFSDLEQMLNVYSDSVTELENGFKRVDVTSLVNHLVQDGKTDREIKSILGSLEKMSGIEMNYPENLDKTLKDVREINEQAEEHPELEVEISSNKDEFFDDLYRACETFDGTVYVGLKVKGEVGAAINKVNTALANWLTGGLLSHANGTDNSKGGLALVNDGGGAELISANGRAYVAGDGKPVITNLPKGAKVFNAQDTRAIFARSGIPSFRVGNVDQYEYQGSAGGGAGTYAGGIPDAGNKPSPDNGKTGNKKLDKILDELSKYIDKILKKAKDALDKQLKAIDEQIDALQREHDADEDANKLEELRLKILEAEKNLVDAQNERTVRYFNKQTGQWEWMADQKAVYEAQQALKEAQEAYDKEVAEQAYQAQIQALKDLKDMLQNQYNGLAEHWQEILTSIQESEDGTIDFESLINRLGLDSKSSGDIRDLIKAIQDYENNLKNGTYTVPLDKATASNLLGSYVSSGVGETSVSKMFGLSTGDANAKGNSIYSTTTSSVVGGTVYYINGVKIGNDLMDKPLSQILSVLPIYAN